MARLGLQADNMAMRAGSKHYGVVRMSHNACEAGRWCMHHIVCNPSCGWDEGIWCMWGMTFGSAGLELHAKVTLIPNPNPNPNPDPNPDHNPITSSIGIASTTPSMTNMTLFWFSSGHNAASSHVLLRESLLAYFNVPLCCPSTKPSLAAARVAHLIIVSE